VLRPQPVLDVRQVRRLRRARDRRGIRHVRRVRRPRDRLGSLLDVRREFRGGFRRFRGAGVDAAAADDGTQPAAALLYRAPSVLR
jgi:hypothetical protein